MARSRDRQQLLQLGHGHPLGVVVTRVAEAVLDRVPDVAQALDRLAALSAGDAGYVLPTYTAMLELQRVVASRGLARPYWEEAAA